VIENTYRKYRIYLSTLVIHAQCLFANFLTVKIEQLKCAPCLPDW